MVKAGYCSDCKKDVLLTPDGFCQFGHPPGSITQIHDVSETDLPKAQDATPKKHIRTSIMWTSIGITIVLIMVPICILLYATAFRSSSGLTYFKTVTELQSDSSLIGKSAKVGGQVKLGSVEQQPNGVTFTLDDTKNSIVVIYIGPMPSTFGEGIQVIAYGTYKSENLFEASSMVTKCPSKYKNSKITAKD